jgi:hypothetical protein
VTKDHSIRWADRYRAGIAFKIKIIVHSVEQKETGQYGCTCVRVYLFTYLRVYNLTMIAVIRRAGTLG